MQELALGDPPAPIVDRAAVLIAAVPACRSSDDRSNPEATETATASTVARIVVAPDAELCQAQRRVANDTASDSASADLPDPVFVNHLTPGGNQRIDNYRYWPGTDSIGPRWYVSQRESDSSTELGIFVYDAEFAAVGEFIAATSSGNQLAPSFAVDADSGDVFLGERPGDKPSSISRWTIDGTEQWQTTLTAGVTGAIYLAEDASGETVVGAVVGGSDDRPGTSNLISPAGERVGDNLVGGADVRRATSHDGELVSVEDGGLALYDPTGTTRTFFINNKVVDSTWNFQAVGANVLDDGTIVATSYNTRAMALFDPAGAVLGVIGADRGANQPLDVVNQSSPIEIVGDELYYNAQNPFGAPNSLTSLAVESVRQLAAASPPFDHLGLGAGIATGVPYDFFASGTTPSATILFSDWWREVAGELDGVYAIRSLDQATASAQVPAEVFAIPADEASYVDGVAGVPVEGLPSEPGYYEISVSLLRLDGSVVGTDCVGLSIGSPALTLDFSTIAADAGDVRGVQLADQFGQRLYRSAYNLVDCVEGVDQPDSATHVACPDGLVADVTAAVELADSAGVTFELQLGTAEGFNGAAVTAGQWERLVGELAAELPMVHHWECWNEPNSNTFSSVTDYVDQALRGCWNGLKNASADNIVIGGSFLDVSLDAWEEFVAAGGLGLIDVAATHPYTGHNRSYEEQGHIVASGAETAETGATGAIQQLQAYLAGAGYTGELYNTESGFWNQGAGSYYSQGDKLVRKTILQQSIGLDRSVNFFNDGEYQVEGLTWALVGERLTPGGLAAATYRSQLGAMVFDSWAATGVPHTYAARYTDPASGAVTVAVWAADFAVEVVPTLDGDGSLTVVDEYGGQRSLAAGEPLTLTGEVQYLLVPAGEQLALAPAEPFGANLAAAAGGATAVASSTYVCDDGPEPAAALVLDEIADAADLGNNCDGMSVWVPADDDQRPTITITLPAAVEVDRVFLAGKGLGSIETGVRSFTVEVAGADGIFRRVGAVEGAYFARANLVSFAPTTVSAIRISDLTVNYTGYGNVDGELPAFWNDEYRGLGGIYTIEAYGPASVAPAGG